MKNYCLVGTGSRGMSMFALPIVRDYQDTALLTGICDINPGRVQWCRKQLDDIPVAFTDFDTMLASVPCDVVIVATKDSLHREYIVRAMRCGKDVITEKPLTIDSDGCKEILKVQEETGRKVQVTFNARYMPYVTRIKEILRSGAIGEVFSIDFQWFLDTVHGADYFRRWHRKKENSGGLLIHKATHHFDLINWWLESEPTEVASTGGRYYFTSDRKPGHGVRCSTCPITNDCEFYLDTHGGQLQALYVNHEQYDGYWRDQCVFSDDTDIEDRMSLLVRYKNGVQMAYSLTASAPFEGWRLVINGSKGRLEAFNPESIVTERDVFNLAERQSDTVRKKLNWEKTSLDSDGGLTALDIYVYPQFGGMQIFGATLDEGEHGGGDKRLRDQLFGQSADDPLGHLADARAGVMSVLIGAAANVSISNHRFVNIEELLAGDRPHDGFR